MGATINALTLGGGIRSHNMEDGPTESKFRNFDQTSRFEHVPELIVELAHKPNHDQPCKPNDHGRNDEEREHS